MNQLILLIGKAVLMLVEEKAEYHAAQSVYWHKQINSTCLPDTMKDSMKNNLEFSEECVKKWGPIAEDLKYQLEWVEHN